MRYENQYSLQMELPPKAVPAFASIDSRIRHGGATMPITWYPGHKFGHQNYPGQKFTVSRNEDGFIWTVEGPVFDIRG